MPAPDLGDPAQREAYRRELSGIGIGLRRWGLGLALMGALLVLVHRHAVPGVPLWLGAGVLGIGVLVMIAAISTRAAYHRLRMRN